MSNAALLVTVVPLASVTTHLYIYPSYASCTNALYVSDFAAEFFHVTPLSVLYCHWYVSPVPVAFTSNVTISPAFAVLFTGCDVIVNSEFTVRLAAALVRDLPLLSVTNRL